MHKNHVTSSVQLQLILRLDISARQAGLSSDTADLLEFSKIWMYIEWYQTKTNKYTQLAVVVQVDMHS